MGTKTADETGAKTGAEATTDEEKAGATELTKTDGVTKTEADSKTEADTEAGAEAGSGTDADDLDEGLVPVEAEGPTGVGQGAGAVVSAALGLVSLTGGWIGTVGAARETLVGQLQTSSSASVATQVKEVYGDAWQTTAVWAGLFALTALIVGVVVLARPAFGVPGRPQPVWIKSVAWGGVTLGVIGLLLAVLKYTDVLMGLPSTS
ncbi:hypothetical protein [Streptomyces resistomycificus]|uniref:Membrane protein n=1 Tax=Streptomyces resistomycificus TaxID=67356 RepID=A0A0L8L9J4_9ACTN|nr:hypothetical protein [Streptomyces resistomycificus]KOG34731.1 membrane protein [Streptomyces resistomycificus]KUN93391.1 hypothetical protein AQJ84_30200 [Streptomyces resistomycificus]